MRICASAWMVLSTYVALFAGVPTRLSAQVPDTLGAPDFSGFWNRVGDLWFDPDLDDYTAGKPVTRLKLNRPDAEDVWAGDADNPVLQPWAREVVKRNAQSEIRREHVYTADDSAGRRACRRPSTCSTKCSSCKRRIVWSSSISAIIKCAGFG